MARIHNILSMLNNLFTLNVYLAINVIKGDTLGWFFDRDNDFCDFLAKFVPVVSVEINKLSALPSQY